MASTCLCREAFHSLVLVDALVAEQTLAELLRDVADELLRQIPELVVRGAEVRRHPLNAPPLDLARDVPEFVLVLAGEFGDALLDACIDLTAQIASNVLVLSAELRDARLDALVELDGKVTRFICVLPGELLHLFFGHLVEREREISQLILILVAILRDGVLDARVTLLGDVTDFVVVLAEEFTHAALEL